MFMNLYTEYANNGQSFIIRVKGCFDFSLMAGFREAYGGLEQQVKTITVDFRETENIDSAGLGMLLNLRKSAGGGKVNIRLIHCRDEIKEQLVAANFEQFFEIS